MAEGTAAPPGGGSAGGSDWLRLASFDAASFFGKQQKEQEEHRAVQDRQLQAAADLLLPSSSESGGSGSSSDGSDEEGQVPAARAAAAAGPAAGEAGVLDGISRRRSKKSRREESKLGGSGKRGESKEERRRRKEKERRRRQREGEREQQVRLERQTGAAQRASQVQAWASGDSGGRDPHYYFDTRGDPANLAFGGLYRMDVAMYRRFDPARYAASLGARRHGQAYGISHLATEADGHSQRDRTSRYFGPASMRKERSGRLKRWRRSQQQQQQPGSSGSGLLGWRRPPEAAADQQQQQQQQQRRMQLPSLNYLPLQPPADADQQQQQRQQGLVLSAAAELAADQQQRRQQEGETNEELLLRRTREFNVATRERPHDIQLWLQFARFQDEALRLGPARRGGERGAAEKKIAILEKALSLHPGSDELLLALLHTAEAVCEAAELERRWRAVLARHSGSPRLWRAYLHHRRTQFSGFSATDVGAAYDDAFAALHLEHRRRAALGAPPSVQAPLEDDAVALAVEGARLRLAAGATERALAAVQVALEYNFFAPEGWPEDALEAMFEEYWRSGAPLAGQPGAAGWAAWMAGGPAFAATAGADDQQRRQAAAAAAAARRGRAEAAEERRRKQQEEQEEEERQKGKAWSGWDEMAPAIRARFGHALHMGGAGEGGGGSGGEEALGATEAEGAAEAPEEEAVVEEETDEQLLERLGVNLEAALEEASTTLTPPLLEAWLATERRRQAGQWQPQRAEAAGQEEGGEEGLDGGGGDGEGEEEAPHRTVAWRDVRHLLWRFESQQARQQLLAGCLLLLGAPLPAGLPSNSPAAASAAGSSDELWQVAAATSGGGSRWVSEILAQGKWGWLAASASSSQQHHQQQPLTAAGVAGAGPQGAPPPPPGLRQQPWYRADPGRQALLVQLLTALVRGPCRQDAALVAALLSVASEAPPPPAAPAAVGPAAADVAAAPRWAAGRALAKQLLAEQRTSLVLWQAYAQLEAAAGRAKVARKVYQTCFATVGSPAGLAAAAAAAPLVLGAVQLELQQGAAAGLAAALPPAAAAAASSSLLPALLAASDAAAAAAARMLAWLGSGGAVALPASSSAAGAAAVLLPPEEAVAAKRGFQDLLLALMQQQQQQQASSSSGSGGGLTAGDRALVAAAAVFEQLAGRLRSNLPAGVKAALAIHDQVLAALMPQQEQQPVVDAQLELLSRQRCQLAADAAQRALPCAPPAAVRGMLLRALRLFPGSTHLLQLLVAHEASGHTIAQLRRELHTILDLRPSPQVWLAMVAVEVITRSPGAVVQATLERAVSHDSGRACPLLWRCYLRFEGFRRRHEAVRRVFLRAIGACPWSKAVWCDGLALLNGHVAPKELSEYLEIMKDKDLVLRTDVFEVLLAQLEGGGGGASIAGGADDDMPEVAAVAARGAGGAQQ